MFVPGIVGEIFSQLLKSVPLLDLVKPTHHLARVRDKGVSIAARAWREILVMLPDHQVLRIIRYSGT
jgi:hypothetical protein